MLGRFKPSKVLLGVIAMIGSIYVIKTVIQPYNYRRRLEKAEIFANYVYEQEVKEKEKKEFE